MKFQDKVMVVTGAGSGIGQQLTIELLARGARVAAVDRSEDGLQQTASLADAGERLSLHVLDVTNREAVQDLPGKVIGRHGAVDGVINNAGIIQPFVLVKDLEYADIDRVMNVNFNGTLYITKEFLPYLLERPEAHLVNVSSMGGFLPVPGQSIYGASKAAVKLLTEGLHSELTETNVKVTVVFPGAIGTNIAANSGVNIGRPPEEAASESSFNPMDPAKAAQIIIDGIEKDRFRVLVGSDARFMDFIYRLAPKFAANYIFKQMKELLPK